MFLVRTLTTDGWAAGAAGPASKEVEREETFPSPESPMDDEGGSTNTSLPGCVSPTVAARGGEVVALNLARPRVSIPQPILNRLGVSAERLT